MRRAALALPLLLLALVAAGCMRLTVAPAVGGVTPGKQAITSFDNRYDDPAGDVTKTPDFTQADLAGSPGLDLVSVEIAAAYGTFSASWKTSTKIPASSVAPYQASYSQPTSYGADRIQSLSWSLSLQTDSIKYEVEARFTYAWEVTVTTFGQNNEELGSEVLDAVPTVDRDTLRLAVPLTQFPQLALPFRWCAWTYWSIGAGNDGSPAASFMDALPGKGISDPNAAAQTIEVPAAN